MGLGLVGMGISAYLTYAKWASTDPFCAGLGSCAQVAASPYAEVWGVPVALLGLAYYATLVALGTVTARRYDSVGLALAVFGLALGGFFYSIYLTYLELFVIRAVCLWCLASLLVVTALLGVSSIPLLSKQRA